MSFHVAIIMDGNGRWAKRHGLPRAAGHKRGAEALRSAVENAVDLGISHLTVYGFSTENWKRPPSEVLDLMSLLRLYLRSEIAELHRQGVRLRFIGDRSSLDGDIVALIDHAEETTRDNECLHLTIALSYGGRAEIVTAARSLAAAAASGKLDAAVIDEALFHRYLYTSDLPDPDLVIRTSGEQRISNFLLWQCAYAELVFVDTLWPDFSRSDMELAIAVFRSRDRRYGAVRG